MSAAQVRKALVAALGFAAIVLPNVFGADLNASLENVLDAGLGLATVLGVFAVRNEPQVPPAA